ncbi:hypothetical protein [Paraoerskovia sediminicola]|nr:hypothetical protein [Paraoerskovia sediminicola]
MPRLQDLEQQIAQAVNDGDLERVATLREEWRRAYSEDRAHG